MHRRAIGAVVAVLLAVTALGGVPAGGIVAAAPLAGSDTAPPTTVAPDDAGTETTGDEGSSDDVVPLDVTPVTVSDFYPEDNNLSDCVGLVEKPGCGSEARGGWRQAIIFVIVAIGMALIFLRVAWGVRKNRRETDERATAADRSDADAAGTAAPGSSAGAGRPPEAP